MNMIDKNQKQYEEFKLSRLYGKLKSNFDCLPEDIIKKHIKPHLIEALVTKYKHKLLFGKSYQAKLVTFKKYNFFTFHDGSYRLAPNIANYAMWDINNY